MRLLVPIVTAFALVSATAVLAQQAPSAKAPVLSSPPADSLTVTAWHRQNVYDTNNSRIGQIMDVLVSRDGKITALVIGAGGFLGMGKHDVMVPFSAVKMVRDEDRTASNDRRTNRAKTDPNAPSNRDATDRDASADRTANKDRTTGRGDRNNRAANNNYRLVMDTTKEALMEAPAVRYDRTAMAWVADDSNRNAPKNRDNKGRNR
jgi:sporulation protein YlmC with PRC-barrel domain